MLESSGSERLSGGDEWTSWCRRSSLWSKRSLRELSCAEKLRSMLRTFELHVDYLNKKNIFNNKAKVNMEIMENIKKMFF